MNMKKILMIIYASLLPLSLLSCVYAKEYLGFEEFVQDIKDQEIDNPNLTYKDAELSLEDIRHHPCTIQYFENYSYVSPMCFYKKDGLSLPIEKSLDYLFIDLEWFMDEYSQDDYNFYYSTTQPYYNDDLFNSYIVYEWSVYEKITISQREKSDKIITIPNNILAKLVLRNYSYYVVPSYTANRGPCSLRNYKIAIEKLNWYTLNPGEELTLNSLIKNNPKACKWSSSENLLFYWWSCGSSTQLFRLSLIMPYLTTTERSNHSKWRSLYYGANLMWDDASMYQNSQKFTVRNDFDNDIYFRVYEKWEYTYLVGIVPEKIDDYIEIFKEIHGLKTEVTKRHFDKNWDIVNFSQFNSSYKAISNSRA